jgi:hypothetical protein
MIRLGLLLFIAAFAVALAAMKPPHKRAMKVKIETVPCQPWRQSCHERWIA